jgi:hypothetical protein
MPVYSDGKHFTARARFQRALRLPGPDFLPGDNAWSSLMISLIALGDTFLVTQDTGGNYLSGGAAGNLRPWLGSVPGQVNIPGPLQAGADKKKERNHESTDQTGRRRQRGGSNPLGLRGGAGRTAATALLPSLLRPGLLLRPLIGR